MVTEWVAKMISTRNSFRAEDLELDQDNTYTDISIPPSGDAPGIALLKHYLNLGNGNHHSQWRHVYDAGNASGNYDSARRGRNKEGSSWDVSDAELDKWIKH